MTCPGSGIELFPDDDGDLVCGFCRALMASGLDSQREAVVPDHDAPAEPCPRCAVLERELAKAVDQALKWRDAARLAAALVDPLAQGEIELTLRINEHTGRTYLSREMWEAIGKKSGWL